MPVVEDAAQPESGRTLLLGCCEAAADEELKLLQKKAKKTVKYANQNKIFQGNLALALSTATLMVLFGMPLFSSALRQIVFGSHICDLEMHGLYLNNGTTETPQLVKVKEWSALEADDLLKIVDCGFIPGTYKGYWPNVCQFCFFSLLTNTGKTVQTTLQGLIGTFIATANVYILYEIFPHGSLMVCPDGADKCDASAMVYKDPNYIPAAAWLEAALFALFWILSKAPVNMVMFLVSYHVFFMSNFLNPTFTGLGGAIPMGIGDLYWDSMTTIINMTSLLGGFLAILATLIPKPLLNTLSLQDNAIIAVQGMTTAWEDGIEYFCGLSKSAKRFSISSKMDAIKGAFDRTEENINGAWFEHFDIGHFGVARELFRLFVEEGREMNKVLQIAKTALVREDFEGAHSTFANGMREDMRKCNDATTTLFTHICKCCVDGNLDAQERADLKKYLEEAKTAEKRLAETYRKTMEGQPYVSEDLSNENCFIYGFASYVHNVTDFAESLPTLADEKARSGCKNFCENLCGSIVDMFSCEMIMKPDNLKFSFVNFLPIVLTFLIAYYVDDDEGHIFVHHAALMPGTLALIITASYGSTFKGNIDRLIGLVLGNVIPLLVLAVVFMFDCASWMRTVTQSLLVFLYFLTFSYVYYSSKNWGFVGCALCGFGAYPLMVSCDASADGELGFNYHMRSNYKVIAQTTVAVLIRMTIETIFLDKAPRDLAVGAMKNLLETMEDVYEEFFKGDYEAMKVADMLATCVKYYNETAPALEVAPGPRLPFKHKFFGEVQEKLTEVISEMGVLVIGALEWHKAEVSGEKSTMRQAAEHEEKLKRREAQHHHQAKPQLHMVMARQNNFVLMQKDMEDTMKNIFTTVLAVLEQDKEESLSDSKAQDCFRKLTDMQGMLDLEAAPQFFDQVNREMNPKLESLSASHTVVEDQQARLTVIVNSLKRATKGLGEIGVLCLRENIY